MISNDGYKEIAAGILIGVGKIITMTVLVLIWYLISSGGNPGDWLTDPAGFTIGIKRWHVIVSFGFLVLCI